jgi:hypothetical protein
MVALEGDAQNTSLVLYLLQKTRANYGAVLPARERMAPFF